MTDNSGLIASSLEKSNPALALSVDAPNAFKDSIKKQGARVALYRNYERGDHRAVITTQMRKMLRLGTDEDASGIQDFNGNYCGIVIDKMAGRLHVSEMTTGDEVIDKDWLAPLLERNDFDNLQSTTIRGALRDADSYVMVDPTDLAWTSEPAYDGYSGVVCIFDPGSRTPAWACKMWSESDEGGQTSTMRLIVYEPGRVSYWRGEEGSSEVEPDNQFISVVSVEAEQVADMVNDRPFPVAKVPIVHFSNRYENYSETGESELRQAITLQDVYNRTLHTMTYASENAGYPKPWVKGMEMDLDGMIPGAVINLALKDAAGNIVTEPTESMLQFLQAVEIGQIEAINPMYFIAILDWAVRQISQVTQTPIYGITAEGNLSGEALKQLEVGLIGKVSRFQVQNVDSFRELVQLTAEIQNAFATGQGSAPVITQVSLTWKSAEILDVTSQIAALTAMRTTAQGLWSDEFYRGKIGGLLSMSQNDIRAEAEAVETQNAERLQRRINSVRVPVDSIPLDGTTPNTETPTNMNSAKGLNGAQITSAVELLKNVSAGITSPEAARELLIALGIDEERVSRMIEATKVIKLDIPVSGNSVRVPAETEGAPV